MLIEKLHDLLGGQGLCHGILREDGMRRECICEGGQTQDPIHHTPKERRPLSDQDDTHSRILFLAQDWKSKLLPASNTALFILVLTFAPQLRARLNLSISKVVFDYAKRFQT